MLELLYPPATFVPPPGFSLRLDNLAGVARLAAALKAPAALRQCAAARDSLGVVPATWEAGYASEGDPRYLLPWLKTADAIPSERLQGPGPGVPAGPGLPKGSTGMAAELLTFKTDASAVTYIYSYSIQIDPVLSFLKSRVELTSVCQSSTGSGPDESIDRML